MLQKEKMSVHFRPRQLKSRVCFKELQMTVESLESKNAAANELAQAAMEEKGQFAQQALAYKQRLLEIENDIQEVLFSF